jgi:glycosyltransferase involved in cell wall biosynthesis
VISKSNDKSYILFVVTIPESLVFFAKRIEYIKQLGFRVDVVASSGEFDHEGVGYHPIDMERGISPFKDIISLYKLIKLFYKLKPTIVAGGTPKAALLASIAAWICRVPIRHYECLGLRLETFRGFGRWILKIAEKITVKCVHQVICVSESLEQRLIQMKIAPKSKTLVIHNGSCCGVNMDHFRPTLSVIEEAKQIRAKFNIQEGSKVIGFTGRLAKDKGIEELVQFFVELSARYKQVELIICGGPDESDPVNDETLKLINSHPNIHLIGHVAHMPPYYHIMDVFVFPTYREGFGTVLLEASAVGLPIVATRVTGVVNAVLDGETGMLVEVRDSQALTNAVSYILDHPEEAKLMGESARMHVSKNFRPEDINEAYFQLYEKLIAENTPHSTEKVQSGGISI